jgi:hypothetical protein
VNSAIRVTMKMRPRLSGAASIPEFMLSPSADFVCFVTGARQG